MNKIAFTVHGRQIEMLPLSALKEHATNPRTHPEDQLDALEAVIRDSGWTAPIIIDEDGAIIAGHGRFQIAHRLGMEQVPCVRVTGLSPAQVRALRLSDNALALRSDWDLDKLLAEIEGVRQGGFDLALTGFTAAQLGEFGVEGFGIAERLARADIVVPKPLTPVIRPGELWQCGRHRILCGDATARKDVKRLLDGVVPCLATVDPPYGVDYDPNWRSAVTGQSVRQSGKVKNDDRVDWSEAWALFPGDVIYCWRAGRYGAAVQQSLEKAGFEVRSQIVWAKDRIVLSRGNYHWRHEPCLYGVRKGRNAHWTGGRKQSTIWRIPGLPEGEAYTAVLSTLNKNGPETTLWEIPITVDDGATGHGTQKPVECMRRPMLNNSKVDDPIYDCFLGSGSSLIAAEMENRVAFGMDIDPGYVEVAVMRWEKYTGQIAKREDGATLASLRRSGKKRTKK